MIAFYISSHGFGHLTRCLAIIEHLLGTTQFEYYVVCDQPQIDFAIQYLDGHLHRVNFSILKTDIGLINKRHSLSVDTENLEASLDAYIQNMSRDVEKEVKYLRNEEVQLIITDISILGILVAKELGVEVIGISNFTWYDQYIHLGIKPDITDVFLKAYDELDYFLEYDFAIDHSYLTCPVEKVGLVGRKLDIKKINLLKRNNKELSYISCGRSASLPTMNVDFNNGTLFYTSGVEVKSNAMVLFLAKWMLDTHNYIAACNVAVIKAGWSSVAEALLARTPIVVIEREGVIEDHTIINQLKQKNLCLSIKEEELHQINIPEFIKMVSELEVSDYENNVEEIGNIIVSHITNGHEWVNVRVRAKVTV